MRALLVYKKSMYQLYAIDRSNPKVQALLKRGDRSVKQLRPGHERHVASLEAVHAGLRRAGYEVTRTYRARIGPVDDFDLVTTVGGDGTLLDVSHHIGTGAPLLGVNSDPKRSVGLLAAATTDNLDQVLDAIRGGRLRPYQLTRLRVELNGEPLPVLALNDVLVAHSNPASTSRYHIKIGRRSESHKSSGIWIASPVGSTAAIRSAGGKVLPLDSTELQYLVREPYIAADPPNLLRGQLSFRSALNLHSSMRDGRLYIDGPHVCHRFGLGATLRIRAVPRSLPLFMTKQSLRRRGAFRRQPDRRSSS